MAKRAKDETIAATLEMTVTYESVPNTSELQELIDKAREYGAVVKANFTVHRAVKQSLV